MKTIHLIRHADTRPGSPDIERALTGTGRRESAHMARRIAAAGCEMPNLWVSAARRAQETAQCMLEGVDAGDKMWNTDRDLYTFQWPELLTWLEGRDEQSVEVTVIGHNPAVTELAEFLSGERMAQVPTGSFIKICAYVGKWADLYRECGQLVEFFYPASS